MNTELIARLRKLSAENRAPRDAIDEAADALEAAQPAPQVPMTEKEILTDKTLCYYFGLAGGKGPVSDKGLKIIRIVEAHHRIGVKP